MTKHLSADFAAALSVNKSARRANLGSRHDFVLEDFFAGRTVANAKFVAVNGVKRHFRIDIDGVWKNDILTLNESFEFDDGERYTKTWQFRKIASGRYLAQREDVLRPVEAIVRNKTLRYSYLLYLDPDNQKNVVRFRDTITMVDDQTLENRAIVLKFGIPVGLVTGVFVKQR